MAALEPQRCIGFSGGVRGGVQVVGDKVAYPLGSMVVVKDGASETLLKGHAGEVTCVASHGTLLATGGSDAAVRIWPTKVLKQHVGKVQAVGFSSNGEWLASLGGRDDNTLVVWDVETGRAVCAGCAAKDTALSLAWLNLRNDRLVTVGKGGARVWHMDFQTSRVHAMDVRMGRLDREMRCVVVTEDDRFAICGTQTGELLQIDIARDDIRSYNDPDTKVPRLVTLTKERFGKGVGSLACLGTDVIAGCGDGTIAYFDAATLKRRRKAPVKVDGAVTSLAVRAGRLIVGTDLCNRYDIVDDEPILRATAHVGDVHDVSFPSRSSEIFATCSTRDVRVWHAGTGAELLRIEVPNIECTCVRITDNEIVTGWSDGKMRGFGPESGKLTFAVPDAHPHGVTALATASGNRILSGGIEGAVRVWTRGKTVVLAQSMKEHKATVTCIRVAPSQDQCISASKDGACLVWCLDNYHRLHALLEPTLFAAALYHPDGSQILTAGTNTNMTYWETYSGEAIRVIKGGDEAITALDVADNGSLFVSGAQCATLKIWDYNQGIDLASSKAHPAAIEAVAIAPDQTRLVSTGRQAAILIWDIPGKL